MILTDTSVVIVYERAPSPRLRRIVADNDAAVCGITVAELFAGVRNPRTEARVQAVLTDFRTLAIPDTLWEQVGRNQSALLVRGVTVPLTDTILAALALSLGVELWAYDTHFNLIQSVIPVLRLFVEPP
jgi:predicted nucleic acid-binding protein